jgi:protein TonB
MSRLFTLGSIVIHAVVLTGVFVAQIVAIGPLPTPREAVIFQDPRLVTVADLPAPARSRAAAEPAVSPDAAPLAPPTGITKETGLEGLRMAPIDVNAVVGVEPGGVPGAAVGTLDVVAPPPPPPPPPPTPVRLRAGIEAPQKIGNGAPIYPVTARLARKSGIVTLEAVIDANGAVQSVKVLRSVLLLDEAAVDAVRQWRFTPARLNGVAIPVVMTVTVEFTLDR